MPRAPIKQIPLLTKRQTDRFWSKVKIRGMDECWEWQRATSKGYGVVSLNSTMFYAHKVSYTLAHGEIPNGLKVLHECDNRPCCNPRHLFLGTDTDNQQDMLRKGRGNKMHGTRHPLAKLTDAKATAIYFAKGSQASIAKQFGTDQSKVSQIKRGLRWPHIHRKFTCRSMSA